MREIADSGRAGPESIVQRGRGFTIVELLVVVAIVAILAAVATPIYSSYLVRGQRSAAKAVLLQTAQWMERFYTTKGSYPAVATDFPPVITGTTNCIAMAPLDAQALPAGATYCVTGTGVGGGVGYLLSATPCGGNAACGSTANTSFYDPACGTLTIDNTGTKSAIGATLPPDQCWQR